jgi:hypothetical protein
MLLDNWLLFIIVVESNIESVFWNFSWVRRSTLQLGACREGRGREKRERSAAKCTDRTVSFHLIYQET